MLYNNQKMMGDHHLRDRFLAGDDEAYAELYRIYSPGLYAFGLSLRVDPSLIEDAIHDIFEDIYNHRNNLKHVNNVKFYFIAAFRNRLFYLMKKETKIKNETEAYLHLEASELDSLEIWIDKETNIEKKKLLDKLMSALNDNQREVIYYRFIEGLSLDDIAHLMGINYQSVKNLIYRSIKKLNKIKSSHFTQR